MLGQRYESHIIFTATKSLQLNADIGKIVFY